MALAGVVNMQRYPDRLIPRFVYYEVGTYLVPLIPLTVLVPRHDSLCCQQPDVHLMAAMISCQSKSGKSELWMYSELMIQSKSGLHVRAVCFVAPSTPYLRQVNRSKVPST